MRVSIHYLNVSLASTGIYHFESYEHIGAEGVGVVLQKYSFFFMTWPMYCRTLVKSV